ncbi:alpha-aminoadipic semialdehyde synthase [Anaeramoeba flamelloides]|uniref:Alpha-aminoadipic semialdehyde synthase n=1 Tax=Anaeramoeba flamelloides TaxID=1746091 RepID=A0AAV7YGC3_9EUKA|nr:alpha-aminoadipic semialdehyde synthase [Anaeramoeba flamelloides]
MKTTILTQKAFEKPKELTTTLLDGTSILKGNTTKTIIIFGAGRMCDNVVNILSKQAKVNLVVCDQYLENAERICDKYPNCTPVELNISNIEKFRKTILPADVIIGLLPPTFEYKIAEEMLYLNQQNSNYKPVLITASYQSAGLIELESKIANSGFSVLSEQGVDPGIDHYITLDLIEKYQTRNGIKGKTVALLSLCGGLPTSASRNLASYRVSFSPRNIVRVVNAEARFALNNETVVLKKGEGFQNYFGLEIGSQQFEWYPNRDSIPSSSVYGLEGINTFIRGTIRFPGTIRLWVCLDYLGFLDNTTKYDLLNQSYEGFSKLVTKASENVDLIAHIKKKIEQLGITKGSTQSLVIDQLKELGLLQQNKIGLKDVTCEDIMTNLISTNWKFEENHQDQLIMKIVFVNDYEGELVIISRDFVAVGNPVGGVSAMAKTVSNPLVNSALDYLKGRLLLKPGLEIPSKENKTLTQNQLYQLTEKNVIQLSESIEVFDGNQEQLLEKLGLTLENKFKI